MRTAKVHLRIEMALRGKQTRSGKKYRIYKYFTYKMREQMGGC